MKERTLINLLISAGLLGAAGTAVAANTSNANVAPSCTQEMRMQTIWNAGPRPQPQSARVEKREVTVCDGKVVKSTEPSLARQSRE